MDRIHLLERKDLHNIKRDFSLGYSTRRHENDAVSVKLWVETMKQLEESPILYFKEQGEIDACFTKDDFILIIMNEFQAKRLTTLGKSKICIDGTHGLNSYGFQLYTIMVVDEFGSGVPGAFCFSNRADTILFQLYFRCVKDRVGLIETETFMSDDYPAFYLAWESVMSPVTNRLLCTWHIKKNWMQNSNKINNKDKRSLVLKTLNILQKELDEQLFLNGLQNFISQLKNDADTYQFSEYFCKTYALRPNMWAYCYRKHVGINTNMYLESLHKTIKHIYLDGKKCKRLDKTINALIILMRDKMFDRIIRFSKQKKTSKMSKISDSHKRSLDISNNLITPAPNSLAKWMVQSSEDTEAHEYVIEKISNDCKHMCELKCQICKICVHMFKCSCPDNVVNYNICKHIHGVCRYFLNETVEHSNIIPQNNDTGIVLTKMDVSSSTSLHSEQNLISSKLEILLGLNKKVSLDEKESILVTKHLDKLIDIFNKTGKVNYQITEEVNVQQRVEPQIRFITLKKKNKKVQFPTVAKMEENIIKEALTQTGGDVMNVHTDFDHTYCEL